jgi:hypothetical protein
VNAGVERGALCRYLVLPYRGESLTNVHRECGGYFTYATALRLVLEIVDIMKVCGSGCYIQRAGLPRHRLATPRPVAEQLSARLLPAHRSTRTPSAH